MGECGGLVFGGGAMSSEQPPANQNGG